MIISFHKGLIPKMNLIEPVEFEPGYFEAAVQNFGP